MNVKESFELISTKTWCSINDIHTRDLPMSVVVEYLNIDINYLKSITTRKEQLNENNK